LDLKNVIAEVISDLELPIKEANGTVNVGQMPTIEGSGPKMRRLFQNLISNGLKYCKADEPPVVSIDSFDTGNGTWEISVEDNGIGFDEKYSGLIFKPFKRLHEKNRYEGTGMGLFICEKITSQHSGNISVTSKVNKGTKFMVTLPKKQSN
jgi:light-regulated signal transduction histidine kinase (bacteriophytochrome)